MKQKVVHTPYGALCTFLPTTSEYSVSSKLKIVRDHTAHPVIIWLISKYFSLLLAVTPQNWGWLDSHLAVNRAVGVFGL